MTDEELKTIEERAAKATPGPWELFRGSVATETAASLDCRIVGVRGGSDTAWVPDDGRQTANAAFIASARSDVPALVAEVRRLRNGIEWAGQYFNAEAILESLDRVLLGGKGPADGEV